MLSRVLLGGPEVEKLAKGEKLTIRLKPNTTELEISASTIARQKINPPKDAVADFMDRLGIRR